MIFSQVPEKTLHLRRERNFAGAITRGLTANPAASVPSLLLNQLRKALNDVSRRVM